MSVTVCVCGRGFGGQFRVRVSEGMFFSIQVCQESLWLHMYYTHMHVGGDFISTLVILVVNVASCMKAC